MSSPNACGTSGNSRCFCPPWLIDAIYDVVHRSPVRVRDLVPRLTAATGQPVSEDMLYMWATSPRNRSGKHRCMPLRWLVPLTEAAENFALVDALERHLGRRVPTLLEVGEDSLEHLGFQAVVKMGEAIMHNTEHLADGTFTAGELRDLVPLMEHLRRTIDCFVAQAQRRLEARPATERRVAGDERA